MFALSPCCKVLFEGAEMDGIYANTVVSAPWSVPNMTNRLMTDAQQDLCKKLPSSADGRAGSKISQIAERADAAGSTFFADLVGFITGMGANEGEDARKDEIGQGSKVVASFFGIAMQLLLGFVARSSAKVFQEAHLVQWRLRERCRYSIARTARWEMRNGSVLSGACDGAIL